MEEYMKPITKDGETLLEVECGKNKAMMYISKLCQGSKGPCILFREEWLTPNEFQFVSGRQTAKDWKRSIRHHGKSLKLLLNKGLVSVHPPICDCAGCRQASPKVKSQTAHKKRAPLAAITLAEDSQQKLPAVDDVTMTAAHDAPTAADAVTTPAEQARKDTAALAVSESTVADGRDTENKERTTETTNQSADDENTSTSRKCTTPMTTTSATTQTSASLNAKEQHPTEPAPTKTSKKRQQPSTPPPGSEGPAPATAGDDTAGRQSSRPPVAVVAPTLASSAPVKLRPPSPQPPAIVTSSPTTGAVAGEKADDIRPPGEAREKDPVTTPAKTPEKKAEAAVVNKETRNHDKEKTAPTSNSASSSSTSSSTTQKSEKIKKPSHSSHHSHNHHHNHHHHHHHHQHTTESENAEKPPYFSSPTYFDTIDPHSARVGACTSSSSISSSSKSAHYSNSLPGSSSSSSLSGSKPRTEVPYPIRTEPLPPRNVDTRDQEAVISSLSSDYYRMTGFPSPRHLESNYLSLLHQYSSLHGSNYCKSWAPSYDVHMAMLPYPVHPSEDIRLYNHLIPTASPLLYKSSCLDSRLCCHIGGTSTHPAELPSAMYPTYEHAALSTKENIGSPRERSPSPRRSLKRKAWESSAFTCYTPMTSPPIHPTVGLDLSVKRPKLDLHRVY